MNTLDDNDEVADLLRRGYAAEADPRFADSLLRRLQKQAAFRRGRRKALWWAAAAGIAIVCGAAAVQYYRGRKPAAAPTVVDVPIESAEPLVVRGRMTRWDAPILTFAVSEVLQGELDATVVAVDLSGELAAMRLEVPRRLASARSNLASTASRSASPLATAPEDAEAPPAAALLFAALLSRAGGRDMVLALGAYSAGEPLAREGSILRWGGVPDPPPRDPLAGPEGAIIVIYRGPHAAGRTHPGHPLTDEWGMPR